MEKLSKECNSQRKPALMRKEYVKPLLVEYGDLGALTQTIGSMGTFSDGGSKNTSKTA